MVTFAKLYRLNWIERIFNNLWRPPRKIGNEWFYSVGGQVDVFHSIDYIDSYNSVPELSAVIGLKARAFSNGIIKAVDKNGKEVDKVPDCLKTPNWFQDQKEFLRQTKLFHEIDGNEYLYMLFPVGFSTERTKALYTIPPNLVKCEYKDSQPFFVHTSTPQIKYTLIETDATIPTEQIIHLNDNRVTVKEANGKNILKGESKMRALTPAINNLKMAYESRGMILKNRGALGILSNAATDVAGSVPLDPEERKRVQNEYRNYGSLASQNHLIITNQNLKWQKMGVNPSELGLFQETEQDFFKICDTYGTPIDLFASIKGSTFENQRQAEKGLYLRTIIPEANEWIGAVSKGLGLDGVTLVMDYSHLHVFQDDEKEKSSVIQTKINSLSRALQDQAITQDEYREELFDMGIGTGKPLPPRESDPDQKNAKTLEAQANLRGSVGGVQGLLAIQQGVAAGTTSIESGLSMLQIIYGFTPEEASALLGKPNTQ